MKRKISLFLCLAWVLVLSACGSGSNSNNASGMNSSTADPGVVAQEELVIKATNYSFDQEEYHLKKGVPVKIVFENESGNHGILIPEFKLQLDSKNSTQVIVPEEAGTFEMSCAIMCGSGHSGMIAKVIVE